jgi:hypothetical protein
VCGWIKNYGPVPNSGLFRIWDRIISPDYVEGRIDKISSIVCKIKKGCVAITIDLIGAKIPDF